MGRITALMYGGYGSANLTYYPRASYLISLPPGNHHWTEWSKNEDQPGSALSAGASFLGTYSRFYNIWGEPEGMQDTVGFSSLSLGSYVFFTKGASQYLVTCQEGLGFEAACVREQHRNNGFAIDCGCAITVVICLTHGVQQMYNVSCRHLCRSRVYSMSTLPWAVFYAFGGRLVRKR